MQEIEELDFCWKKSVMEWGEAGSEALIGWLLGGQYRKYLCFGVTPGSSGLTLALHSKITPEEAQGMICGAGD